MITAPPSKNSTKKIPASGSSRPTRTISRYIPTTAGSRPSCSGRCVDFSPHQRIAGWQASVHGVNERGLRSEYINCHLQPKEDYFTHLTAKGLAGARDIYKHHFGGEYDVEKMQEKALEHVSNERCLYCHVDLLAKPSSDDVKETHAEVLNPFRRMRSTNAPSAMTMLDTKGRFYVPPDNLYKKHALSQALTGQFFLKLRTPFAILENHVYHS